jgi:outer membrane protein OmpA-like peptidoglycan-associated protein
MMSLTGTQAKTHAWHRRKAFLAAVLACSGLAAQRLPAVSIPLCPGFTVVTAVQQQYGDYESIKTVESVDAKEVRLKYSSESMLADPLSAGPPKVKQTLLYRTILQSDLDSAGAYQQVYLEKSAETIPGTTAIGASRALLRALKAGGEVEMKLSNAYGGLELTADSDKRPNYYDYLQPAKLKMTGTVRVPVVLNDEPVELPAIRAQGDSVGEKEEFDFLDDENNPLTLAFRVGIGGVNPLTAAEAKICNEWRKHPERPMPSLNAFTVHGARCDMPNGGDLNTLRVIKINSRCSGPGGALPATPAGTGKLPDTAGAGGGGSSGAKALEQALAQNKKVDIYSIYFSFNSDKLRDESQPTLKEIADILRRHPDWKLQVNGHTDAIGGDQFNLDLSQRRSAAVKESLVGRYQIGADRLVTAGYGRSQPRDTNDTLEGRARNRRVELMRIP